MPVHGMSRSGAGEQLTRRNIERPREPHNGLKPRIAARALQETYLGSVQIAGKTERLLGHASPQPVLAQVGGEPLTLGRHTVDPAQPLTEPLQTKTRDPDRPPHE